MITILQPHIPHYREDFFIELSKKWRLNLFCYDVSASKSDNFSSANIPVKKIKCVKAGPFMAYNPFSILTSECKCLILMLNFGHLTTWLLILTKIFHKKKIILWGHGISVKRYMSELKSPSMLLRWMIWLSDGVFFYTEKELAIWKQRMPDKQMVSLNNTISKVEELVNRRQIDIATLKKKYSIHQNFVLIYCARFNNSYRRVDLLIQAMKTLDPTKFAFIVIGGGKLKPDFTMYENVYDYGEVYEKHKKDELFQMANAYYQPGWVGLSIVEAMAYGKPVLTFSRSVHLKQCVEFAYIKSDFNGIVFDDFEQFLQILPKLSTELVDTMGKNAIEFVTKHLLMSNMINKADELLKCLMDDEKV